MDWEPDKENDLMEIWASSLSFCLTQGVCFHLPAYQVVFVSFGDKKIISGMSVSISFRYLRKN